MHRSWAAEAKPFIYPTLWNVFTKRFQDYPTQDNTPRGYHFWPMIIISPGVVFCGSCAILCSPSDKKHVAGAKGVW